MLPRMPKYLLLDDKTWRLPATADERRIHEALRQSMADGNPVAIGVELGDDPRGQVSLTVNGSAATQFTIVDLPE